MDILDQVPAMTGGRVSVGSGTLYNLLEQFREEGMIRETRTEGRPCPHYNLEYRVCQGGAAGTWKNPAPCRKKDPCVPPSALV